jgi:thiamine kinase-like enzyme
MSKALDIALKAAEQQTEKEITSKFSARMQASLRDAGEIDTMRHTIISLVANENYQRAIEELHKFVESKSDFPQFQEKTQRYIQYAVDLINATKAKRSFPGLQHLAMSKQQELFDRAMDHFDDLKLTLKKVEKIEKDAKLEDLRSTIWVIKAMIYCCFLLLAMAFLIEVSRGVLPAASIVVDDLFGTLTNKLFDLLGF